ncbi:hypothetical protein DSO57_1004958 [Entomophthora muscae]|uniref:Uncharacterized protein n=1 Tax=Entomophthora muscae TaxID=34485 RepID=A0ACC2U5T9_9FUNG|nr:hypothetical protein DSO57_1004958 [Entomophthora muscae]
MRQTLIGLVVGTAAKKTVKVCVPRARIDKHVKKEIIIRKNYAVHDETEKCGLGDVIRIEACRPMSKTKRFCVAEIIKPAATYKDPETGVIFR